MTRTSLRVMFSLTVLGAAIGLAVRTPHTSFSVAQAAGAAVTPKTEAPNEARALSHAFSNVAKALAPSVVRIEVEVGAPKVANGRGRAPGPNNDEDGDDNGDVP